MNSPEPNSDEDRIPALLAALDRDTPAIDRAVLAALRDSSSAAFLAAAPPTTPRKRTVKLSSLRWIAAVAALLVVGAVFANWVVRLNRQPEVGDPTPVEKFKLADKLTDDGRIGNVTDVQGVVSIKPVLAERWSPAPARLVLKPGDWLRTDPRGANAASLRLLPTTSLIVGPHSTVELTKANEIRLVAGEIEIAATVAAPVELRGPDKQTLKIDGRQFVRIEKDKLVRVAEQPPWLKGFKGTAADETLGSLVAMVDGRNVPLTVGYHHVTVDIRDQIARTVIEESFVNRTDAVLEGVFHFPLPQDASISGFGMWIGDKLVEADVVEKQRAREIYETILRENRDPALLEWAGGNIFKARVYPIPAHSEKRIRISYTQVLPMKGNRYRYGYALQSELLKQHPLRDLTIDVKISSSAVIKSVTSPTHDTRLAQTEHSGHVEFAAQEYTPTRDFEAVVELAARQSDVTVIPHQRGSDGYFLVQLTPPSGAGSWERPLIPDGEPLKLLVIADTSASMDRGQRATQNALIASLLAALTPKDTINVAACDVNCDWIFEKAVPATPENGAIIRDTLAKRVSLGWSDLDKAFASAVAKCEPGTHAVYLGDGISTSGDADPVAFAKRLAKLGAGKPGTFHTVALGSSFEPAAMKAIAALGSGSVRRVTGEQGLQAIVAELLTEIASPTLRNLKVEITGVRTARLYPEVLPNVAAGSQQTLLGRYLPEGKDQEGEIVVTGMLGAKPVRYTSKFSLKDAEQGNSFLPRLWARMHLDTLLEQGTSPAIKDEVIALSEEFNIITPYTSLLVLETDADRERFAVKRRFQMRDGERFFADGRDNALFELKQKQMRLAGDHRTALRRQVLRELQSLGRNPRLFQQRFSERFLSASTPTSLSSMVEDEFDSLQLGLRIERPVGGMHGISDQVERLSGGDEWDNTVPGVPPRPDEPGLVFFKDNLPGGAARGIPYLGDPSPAFAIDSATEDAPLGRFGMEYESADIPSLMNAREPFGLSSLPDSFADGEWNGAELGYASKKLKSRITYGYRRGGLPWLNNLFPQLPTTARASKEPATTWPAPALVLSRSLLRKEKLAQLKGGLAIARTIEGFDIRDGARSGLTTRSELVSPTAWAVRTIPSTGPVIVQWCDGKELGAINTAYGLGRIRAANPFDVQQATLGLEDYSIAALHHAYPEYTSRVEAIAKDRALLILQHKTDKPTEIRYLIDTARNVVLTAERRWKGKVQSTRKFGDFVEVAGTWWARTIESLDTDGKRTALETQTIAEVSAEEFAKRMTAELAAKERVLFLKQPLPTVAVAKAAIAAGKATFDDRAVLTLHFAATQQWARAKEHLAECERLAKDRPGMRWLTNAFLLVSRQHEDLRKRLLDDAAKLELGATAESKANAYFLPQAIFAQAQQVLPANELLALWTVLEKVHAGQPAHLNAVKLWRIQSVALLQQTGDTDAALALSKGLAVEYPKDAYLQYLHARNLANGGDTAAAYAWLDSALAAKWRVSDAELLRGLYAEFLRGQSRSRELADFLAKWIDRNPEGVSPYAQYLAALVRSNRAEKAETLVDQWLRDGRVKGELARPTAARLTAAVAFALGNGYGFNTQRIDERWHAALAETAFFFARNDDPGSIAEAILGHWRFATTDAGRSARTALAKEFLAEIATVSPERIARYRNWIWSDAGLENADWETIGAALRKRWDAEKDAEVKHALGQSLAAVLSRWIGDDDLDFLRVQWKTAGDAHRSEYANQFFNALLVRPWKAEREAEIFALLAHLAPPGELAGGLATRVAALHRLTDALVESRYQALLKAVDHPEKLTRTDLQKKQTDLRKLAREGFADRLRAEAAKQPKPIAEWLTIERLWLEVLLERDLGTVTADAGIILDAAPIKPIPDDDDSRVAVALDDALKNRAYATLMNLAARKGADPVLVERLLKHVDARIAAHTDEPSWKGEKFKLLIALDRAEELEAELRRWIALPDPDNRWRLALGTALAERGKLAEAIALFEAVEAADELAPDAYRTLADWYAVENRRLQSEKATAALYKTTDEYSLHRRVLQYLRPWQSGGHRPTQLDPEVFAIFKVLFDKGEQPQQYLGTLQQFYGASRDFRLLAMLPDGVVGHSAGAVYGFLKTSAGALAEIRDEATADELIAGIGKVRERIKSPVDLRALDLLEVLVERRAAELQNQPGPHAARALAALDRAFKRDWAPGEPKLMAEFLADLGNTASSPLAELQTRQLESLHRDAKAGTADRLAIAANLAAVLHGTRRFQPAMDVLEAALKESEAAHAGLLPAAANDALGRYIGYAEDAGEFARGEKMLLAQLGHALPAHQKSWLIDRLDQLSVSALIHGGEVSLGKKDTLYKALEAKLIADLGAADQPRRSALITRLASVYRTAHGLQFAGVAADLKAFAFGRGRMIFDAQESNRDDAINVMAAVVHDLVGPREGIAFLLDRAENEPDWVRYESQDTRNRYANRLGEWRLEVKEFGDADGRLLKFVLAELRRDLRSREAGNRTTTDRRHSYYWPAKEAEFAKVAEEILAERKASGASVEHIAEYLFFGLGHEKRAVEILAAAHAGKLLSESGQWRLVDYLHRTKRYAESIPLLFALVEREPESMAYRTKLMHAYFRIENMPELLALLKRTDVHFHEQERWTEGASAALAESTLENRLFAQSVTYFEELLPRYRRSRGDRSVGDGTLHHHYLNAADAYAGLGNIPKAVEMASAAVVVWPAGHAERKEALDRLVRILELAPKLDAYTASLDAEPLQSAVIRKALGRALMRKNEHARAIPQLRLAAELQPGDAEVYALLVECFDKIGDKEGAVLQLLDAVELSRRDLKLYAELGRRLSELRRPAEAERANTSIVEMQPNESESHALLAEVREKQNRWPEAIAHWTRVALIRELEPTGLLKLAAAHIHEKAWAKAAEEVRALRNRKWPERFSELPKQIRELEKSLEAGMKQ